MSTCFKNIDKRLDDVPKPRACTEAVELGRCRLDELPVRVEVAARVEFIGCRSPYLSRYDKEVNQRANYSRTGPYLLVPHHVVIGPKHVVTLLYLHSWDIVIRQGWEDIVA